MDLFDKIAGEPHNLLPHDGTVHYYGPVMSQCHADQYFEDLLTSVKWKNDEAVIFGKNIITKRKVAWYGEHPFSYTYSKITKTALPWTKDLLALKEIIEQETGECFNSCLLNLYHDGSEGMAWHSDGERDLKKSGAIGSLSLGAERKFSFKHKKTKENISQILQHGSLLVMKDTTQENWLHCLSPTKTIHAPRINLTFRTIDKGIMGSD